MILEDLRGYLNANSIAPIYLSFEPSTSGITLYLYAGRQADPWNPAYHYYNLQVISRYADFQTSQTIIRQVQNVLTNLAGIVGSTDIVNCYPKQDPYQLGYDAQNQARLVQNFEIEAKEDVSIDPVGYIVNGSYFVNWDNVYNTPTTLSGYGITDGGGSSGVPNTRTLTINGIAYDLSANRTWLVGDIFASGLYADPSWITSLDYAKLINVPAISGTGTVTSVALEAPSIFDVTGSPITSSGTLTLDLVTQAARTLLSGPINGVSAVPTFRLLEATDLPIHSQQWSTISGTPSTLAGYGILDAVINTRALTINGLTQNLTADRTWSVGDVFTTSAYTNPSWIVSLDYSKLTNVPATSGTGTVFYVGLSAPSIFNVANSPIVSSGTFNLTLANQNANTVFSGPITGSPDLPTFRSLVADDLPSHFHDWNEITNTPHTLSGYGIVDAVWISGAYSNPAWLTSLAWSKISGTPTTLAGYGISDAYTKTESDNRYAHISISGTLRSVGFALPDIFTVQNSPLTGSGGTISGVLNSQTQNRFFASPYGTDGLPSFRAIGSNDIPSGVFYDRTITINGLTQDLSANRTWSVGDVFTTSSYTNPAWLVSIPWSKITNTPTTLLGYGITDSYTKVESDARFAPISYSGTVRYVGLELPSSIFDVSNSPIISSGTITATLDTQASGTIFAGPTTGSNAQPTFRTLVLADLPDIPFAAIVDKPTTLAGYGISDVYTMVQSDGRYIPSGLLPPLAMYWTSSGQIYFVAHSGMALGFPYLAGSGTLVYERALASNQTSFSAFTFPLYLTFNDIFRVTCSANIGAFRSATFPRIA